ncbi:MBL fold metallo-hydrolase [uncultured Bacteroides sp.]|uniref:MBL fold metallo-hydrolase n=1 Tax=uncultured Bacteroides sp. TaxID=162156 RepID=UPI002AAB08E1|nr:MBL fold metallo-hydrolase [uncultured Bacteroides sp.]
MEITILGSGTSTGVPEVGCTCSVCKSSDPHDNRLRASALIKTKGINILIDCGPDFREQMLHSKYARLDGVLITHEHYDHVGGIDDLRPFCRFGEVPLYTEESTAHRLRSRMPYCFAEHKYPGVPQISITDIKSGVPFYIDQVKILPIRVLHGKCPILGYRIENIAYITDMLTMPDEEYGKLKGLDCLIMNALREEPHITHQNLKQAIENAKRIGAKQTWFIHMSHHIGLHAEIEKQLPPNIHFAYDRLVIKP